MQQTGIIDVERDGRRRLYRADPASIAWRLDVTTLDLASAASTYLASALEAAGLTANKNGVPGDPEPPTVTSGLRLGASAGTARGLGTDEFSRIGRMVAEILHGLAAGDLSSIADRTRAEVADLCRRFPVY